MRRLLLPSFAIAVLFCMAGCPSQPLCSPDTCAGCCNANDVCETSTPLSCGVGGQSCITCGPGQQCTFGLCGYANSGGGAGGGTGGGGIDAGNDAGSGDAGLTDGGTPDAGRIDAGTDAGSNDAGVPFNVGCWNLEWFADDAGLGPSNNALQQTNVQTVLQTRSEIDLWGIEEVVGTAQFSMVAANLPGFQVLYATDVSAGTFYYGLEEQKVGLLWRSSKLTLVPGSARLILVTNNYDFGSRPPLEAQFRFESGGLTRELYVIVMHMKAFGDSESYDRRTAASVALKGYLDSARAGASVIVVGDWNDDLDQSTYMNSPSPFLNLVNDSTHYKFPTQELTLANKRTSASSSRAIDHQLITAPLFPSYVTGSAAATVPSISGYSSNTSDHYPVTTRHVFH